MLEALRAYHDSGMKLPCRVRLLIEGEEEVGSPTLAALLEQHRDQLAAPTAVVCDTAMWDYPGSDREPDVSLTLGLRGIAYFDLKLGGPVRDLHSGVYGGVVANPGNVLLRVLGQLVDAEGRVTIPGFYDDVPEVSEEERAAWDGLGFKDTAFADEAGATLAGEAGRTTLERLWARPSCDVNGALRRLRRRRR